MGHNIRYHLMHPQTLQYQKDIQFPLDYFLLLPQGQILYHAIHQKNARPKIYLVPPGAVAISAPMTYSILCDAPTNISIPKRDLLPPWISCYCHPNDIFDIILYINKNCNTKNIFCAPRISCYFFPNDIFNII